MNSAEVKEPQLERQSRRLAMPVPALMAIAAVLALPGILLVILTHSWVYDLGWVLIALGIMPAVVAFGLMLSALVGHWAARHRPFA